MCKLNSFIFIYFHLIAIITLSKDCDALKKRNWKAKVKSRSRAKRSTFFFFLSPPPLLAQEMLSGTKRSPAFICLSRFSWWSNRTISLLYMTKRRIENYLLLYLSSSDLVAEAIRAQISNYCRLSTIYHPGPMGYCTEAGRDCTLARARAPSADADALKDAHKVTSSTASQRRRCQCDSTLPLCPSW